MYHKLNLSWLGVSCDDYAATPIQFWAPRLQAQVITFLIVSHRLELKQSLRSHFEIQLHASNHQKKLIVYAHMNLAITV